jgi:hypothetical protein
MYLINIKSAGLLYGCVQNPVIIDVIGRTGGVGVIGRTGRIDVGRRTRVQ